MTIELDAAEAAARSFYSNTVFPDLVQPAGETLMTGDGKQESTIDSSEAAARKVFPNTSFSGQTEVKPGDLPDAVKVLRDQPARKMFDAAGMYRDAFRRSEFADTDPAVDAAVNAEAAEIMQDLGINNAEASTLVNLARTPASEETFAGWEAESNKYLATLGNSAREDLQLARTLVQRDRRVAAMLDETGLGSNPEVLRIMIEKARSARIRGEI